MNKVNFKFLIDNIKAINKSLSFWLGDCSACISEELLPKVLDLKTIKINNFDFLEENELHNIVEMDKKFTKEIQIYNFEREVLLKKKELALKELDINNAITFVKFIDEVDNKLKLIKSEIDKLEKSIDEKNCYYLSTYNSFVEDIQSKEKNKESMHKNTAYSKKIVQVYRINKILSMITDCCPSEQIYELFENQDVKSLLGSDYFRIKQKVSNYVGTNS